MAYLVLARKYRPHTFADVVGQEVATRVLQGAIREERIGHAYLLCGSRGTGKTTLARIFAKAINCEQGPSAEPCGTCETCVAFDAGTAPDFLEIDGASNRGIDNVRALREQVAYAPMQARYKVYLIDEVHSVTRDGFNALLKTLEEPPPHVVFLFATTEPHKVIDTITSRCQVLELASLSEEAIAARLAEIAGLEEMQPGPGVLEEIARRARGGLRDALSLLDQARALVGDAPALEDLRHLGGEATDREVDALLSLVEAGDRAGVLAALADHDGREGALLDGLLAHVRGAMVSALCGREAPFLPPGEELRASLFERAQRLGPDRLQAFLAELVHARDRAARLSGHGRVVLELALLELCREETTAPLAELAERLLALESGEPPPPRAAPAPAAPPVEPRPVPPPPAQAPAAAAPPAAAPPADEPAASKPAAPPAEPPAEPPRASRKAPEKLPHSGPPRTNKEAWERCLDALAAESEGLAELLRRRGRLEELLEDRAVVHLDRMREEERRMTRDPQNRETCSRVFSAVLERTVAVTLDDGADTRPGADDPFTQEVADLFDGQIDDRGAATPPREDAPPRT